MTSWKTGTTSAAGIALALTLLLPAVAACSKRISGAPTGLPQLLANGAQINGLSDPSMSAWHLKATYQPFDPAGKPKSRGTYEEFWVSGRRYKRSYASAEFTQTDFATDQGLYRSGNQDWPGPVETRVRTDLIQPVPADTELRDVVLRWKLRAFGKESLQCISLVPKRSNVTVHVAGYTDSDVYPQYCFAANEPILRFRSRAADRGIPSTTTWLALRDTTSHATSA